MDVLDETLLDTKPKIEVKYGRFWSRFGATILDSLVLLPISFGINYFNIISWKNVFVLVALELVTIAYKPFMEATYGATLGKMALNLKVVNLEYEQASLAQILMRNIFHLVPSIISLFFTVMIYADPEFESISGFMEYSAFARSYGALGVISSLSAVVTVIDGIVMIADEKSRSLHDKIGGTYVIDRS